MEDYSDTPKLTCQNCGAPLEDYGICEYCGTNNERPVPEAVLTGSVQPEYIVPFLHTEQDVKEEMIKYLIIEEYVPLDIFEHLQLLSIEKKYVLRYFFEGHFDAPWNCIEIIEVKKERTVTDSDGKSRTEYYYENEYHDRNGMASGTFAVMGDEKNILPDRGNESFPETAQKFSEKLYDKEAKSCEFSDENKAWENAQKAARDVANSAAYYQMPIKKSGCSTSPTVARTSKSISILAAYWHVKYKYKNTVYEGIVGENKELKIYKMGYPFNSDVSNKVDEIKDLFLKRYDDTLKPNLALCALILSSGIIGFNYLLKCNNVFITIINIIFLIFGIWGLAKYYKGEGEYNRQVDEYNNRLKQIQDAYVNNALAIRIKSAKDIFGYDMRKEQKYSKINFVTIKMPQPPSEELLKFPFFLYLIEIGVVVQLILFIII